MDGKDFIFIIYLKKGGKVGSGGGNVVRPRKREFALSDPRQRWPRVE